MIQLTAAPDAIDYPSSDGEPLAETYDHLCAIINTFGVLTQLLKGQRATVLADQFMYYAQGYPKLRVAPDVMVIFDVLPPHPPYRLENKPMGESKRRQESDPNFGQKPKVPPENPIIKQVKSISKGEWVLWGVVLGSSLFLSIRAFMGL